MIKIGDFEYKTISDKKINFKNLLPYIYVTQLPLTVCPQCGHKLVPYKYAIKVSVSECIKTDGLACYECGIFISKNKKLFYEIEGKKLLDNTYQLKKELDVCPPSGIEKLRSDRGTLCQLTICSAQMALFFTIVVNKWLENTTKNIFHYSSSQALRILTAVFLKQREVYINGCKMYIEKINRGSLYANTHVKLIHPDIVLDVLPEDDGYRFPAKTHSEENNIYRIDGLVLGVKNRSLGTMPLLYDSKYNTCSVHRNDLLWFVHKYGLPINRIVRYNTDVPYQNQLGLNEESIMHVLGYSAKKDGPNQLARQALLASLIDSGQATADNIAKILSGLIRLKGYGNPQAASKWNEDLIFIQNYQPDLKMLDFVNAIRSKKS